MKKAFIITTLISSMLIIAMSITFSILFVQYDKKIKIQNNRISSLEALEEYRLLKDNIVYTENGYNYLAIGNSITIHDVNEYWFSNCGMGASKKENDYFHLVKSNLENKEKEVNAYAMNYIDWELQSNDRAETYTLINKYLSPKIDLITIQLGENVNDMSTFEFDLENLINYIKKIAFDAKIIVVDDFWKNDDRTKIKQDVCNKNNIAFVSLDEIKDNLNYQCGMNSIVYDDLGNPHQVNHTGVAKHPNDAAMKYIADRIIDVLNKK